MNICSSTETDPIHDALGDEGLDGDREAYEDYWDRMDESVNGPVAP